VKDLHPDTVRIILSGHAEVKSVIDAINGGAVYRFFTKPCDSTILREGIRAAFQQYRASRRVSAALA